MQPRAGVWMATGPIAIMWLATACAPAEGDNGAASQEDAAEALVRVVNVEAAEVTSQAFTGYIRVTGEVEALNDVTISAEEAGRIVEFLARKGQRLERGQPIAKLEDDVLAAQVMEARASAALAREEWERQRQLWEEDSIGTEVAYLQRKYQADIAAARVAQLESRLERTVIRAPVAGVFDARFLEQGEMATPGMPVARVVDTYRVKITAGVPERYARSVGWGDSAVITFDIFPGQEFRGRVSFVGASVDERSRTFPIEIILANPQGIMKPAMLANVEVERDRLDDVIVVPQQVVLRSADGYKVFVVEPEGDHHVAKARAVTLGAASGNDVVITEGLSVGEQLVTVGQKLVDDNSRVRIVNSGGAD